MTYEQLLELEEENGKVSKGLKPAQIAKLKEKVWRKVSDTAKKETKCTICMEKFKMNDKFIDEMINL